MSLLIKICGINDPTMAYEAVQRGAHYIGIVTFSKSPRYVELNTAKRIAEATQQAGGIPVALFVDADAATMQSFCHACDIDTVQLHGSLARTTHHLLANSIKRIYAVPVHPNGKIEYDPGYSHLKPDRDLLLFDSFYPGSGTAFSKDNFQGTSDFPYFIAGGLSPENVRDAIQLTAPQGVDVSSGVERTLGIKDMTLIENFIQAIQSCEN